MKYLSDVTTLRLFDERCTGCGMCAMVCPHGVLVMDNGIARIVDRDACMECSACLRNCPEEAITVQPGVGCAQAVINTALGRSSTCCDLGVHETSDTECGPANAGCGDEVVPQQSGRSDCC
jgi:NAD-dependent dihydropyrimidine dehydrogenase PreA subunit